MSSSDRPQLTSLDSDFLHLETAWQPMHFAIALELEPGDRRLSVEEVRARVGERAGSYRQFHSRVARGVWRRPVLKAMTEWNPADHVDEFACDRASEASAHIERLLATPLPRQAPLWRITLLTDRAAGRQLLVLRIHHCMADGLTSIGHAALLLDGNAAELEPFTRFLTAEPFAFGPVRPREAWRAYRGFWKCWTEGRTEPRWPGMSRSGTRSLDLVAIPTRRLRERTRELSMSTLELVLTASGAALSKVPPCGSGRARTIRVSMPVTLDPTFRHIGNATSAAPVNLDGAIEEPPGQLPSVRYQLRRIEKQRPELVLPMLGQPPRLPWVAEGIATRALMAFLRFDIDVGVNPVAARLRHVLGHRIARVYAIPSLLGTSLAVAGVVLGDLTTFGIVSDGGSLPGYAATFGKEFRSALEGECE